MDLVDSKLAELRKRRNEITFEMEQLETLAAKRQRCSNDVEEAICLLKSDFMDLRQVLEHFPGIGPKREFWEAFLRSKSEIRLSEDFGYLVGKYARPLLEDRDLVLKLCAYDTFVYCYLSSALRQDEGIVEAVLTRRPLLIRFIDEDVQQMHPDLVASALERLLLSIPGFRNDLEHDFIHESIWAHRNVALAWASAGGLFLVCFPEEFTDDEELLLAFLQNGSNVKLNPTPRLLAEKQFMLKAAKASPTFLAKVSNELTGDWDLLLAAMANPRILLLRACDLSEGGWVSATEKSSYRFWADASKTVRDKLRSHDIFVKLMLGGMMAATSGSTTPLTLFNQGKETSLAFTKPIAEYLGVPTGEELRLLREARKNLALMGIDCS
jgi:hypothetical protein